MGLRAIAFLAGVALGFLWTKKKIEPALAKAFPDSDSVNWALRFVLDIVERKKHRFIDFNKVLPGDIIFTRPHDKDSKVIATATAGAFSHAQSVRVGPIVLEATYDDGYAGIRDFIYETIRIKRKPRRKIEVCDISEDDAFEIFRYRPRSEAEKVGLDRLRDEVMRGSVEYLGYPYASPETLAKLSPLFASESLQSLGEEIISSVVPEPAFEGFYCSQLVMILYEEAGIPLVDAPARKARVTPNELSQVDRLTCVTSEASVDLSSRELIRLIKSWQFAFSLSGAFKALREYAAEAYPVLQKYWIAKKLGKIYDPDTGRIMSAEEFWAAIDAAKKKP